MHGLGALFHLAPAQTYALFALMVLSAAGFCMLALARRLRDPARPRIVAFLTFHAAFVILMTCIWLYAWDLPGLLVFTVFNALVLLGSSRGAFAALFAIGILNHEITLAIAGWLVLDPVVLIIAIRLAASDWIRFGALAIVTVGMVASFLCFGLVLETRALMPLVPFVALHGWAAVRSRAMEI